VLAKTQVVAAPTLPLTSDPPSDLTQAPAAPTTGSRSRTQPTRHSQLSNEQILLALSESYNIIAAITKYQVFLAGAIGLPKDDTGRVELMAASMTVLEKIRTEIRALEHELDRREDQEKRGF
jgi:hypothetical protein